MKLLPANISNYPHPLPDLSPPVVMKYNAFDQEFCKAVSKMMIESDGRRSGVHGSDGSEILDDYHRSSSFCILPADMMKILKDSIQLKAMELLSVHSRLRPQDLRYAEDLQLLKYDSKNSGHFKAHTDNAFFDAHGKFIYSAPSRVITTVTYMNDNYEGGDIVLNSVIVDDAPLRVKPTTGLMIMFPSDVRFMHEVLPVTNGIRTAIVGWFTI